MTTKWSLVVIHEGHTTTQKILERGFLYLQQRDGIQFRLVEFRPDSVFSIAENEIPILIRCASPWVANFTEKLVAAGKPYFYFIDDDFWSIDLASPLGQYYRSPSILASLKKTVTNASVVVTNTEIMSKRLSRLNTNTKLIPAYFDFTLVDEFVSQDTTTTKPEGTLRIGFASNHSRLPDFQPIEQTLVDILSDYPNCELDVIGLTPDLLRQHPSVNVFPHLDSYEAYIDFQLGRAWDVGLAPLRPSKQNSAKTNNKYREYAAMSIAGVYADEAPYSEVVNGVNGMKAGPSPSEWNEAIRALLDDAELRARVVTNGLAAVRERYGIDHIMDEWLDELQLLAENDANQSVDWNRDNLSVPYPRALSILYVYRTRGFRVWLNHYLRRAFYAGRLLRRRRQIRPRQAVQSIVAGSIWRAPRDRFAPLPPSVSVVFTVTDTISLNSLKSAVNSVLQQQGVAFELIIVVDSVQPDVIDYVDSVFEQNGNVGVITHQDVIDRDAISLAEGYLKTRGAYILPTSGDFVFAPDAFVRLSEPMPHDVKAAPICVVHLSSDSASSNPEVSAENESTMSIWPAPDRDLEFVSLIDRRIIEFVGLEDPHPAISEYAKYDFWRRILANSDLVNLDQNVVFLQKEDNVSPPLTDVKASFGKSVQWMDHNRTIELRPNAIMNYDLLALPSWFKATDDVAPHRSARVAVVSIGQTNDAELHFSYLPEEIQQHVHHVTFRSVADFDESLFDFFDSIVWTSQHDANRIVMERARERSISQFLFAPAVDSIDLRTLESGLFTAALAPTPEIADQLRSIGSAAKVLEFPFWLSKSRTHPPLPVTARDANSLTIGAICEADSVDRFRTVIAPALAKLAIEMRIDLRLVVLTSSEMRKVEWLENDKFSVERIPYSSDQLTTLRRIGSKHPDFMLWSGGQSGTLLHEAGIPGDAIAAVLGCFSVSEVTINEPAITLTSPLTITVEHSHESMPLSTLLTNLAKEPTLRESLAKANQTSVWHAHSAAQAKQTLHEITKLNS